jgi:HPt (histidine-containing phosphotransfer) domain-containing protein
MRLYRDLLLQFAARQSGVDSQLQAAIHNSDHDLVERIAHTVKGVAGNIGLRRLFTVAGKLERAACEKDPIVPALVEEFALTLGRQIDAIRTAMGDRIPDRKAPIKRTAGYDRRAISSAIARLRNLLKSGDVDALDAFAGLVGALANNCDRVRLHALRTSIDEFDFEDALVKLEEIAKEYSANGEPIR